MAETFRPVVKAQKSDLPTPTRSVSASKPARGIKWFGAQLPGEYSCLFTGITCAGSGHIVVCDNENKSVKRFLLNGKLVDKLTLIDPCGLCYLPHSVEVAITEPDVKRLTFCSLNDHIAISSTSKTKKKYECIAALDDLKLIVGCCELGSMSVDVIDSEGNILRSIQNDINGESKLFRYPAAITCHSSGEILISDPGSCKLICISPDGKTQFKFDPEGRPSGVCVDSTGMIYMAEYDSNTVYRLSPEGEKESIIVDPSFTVTSPLAMAVDENYLVLTEDMPSTRILIINLAPIPERQATGLSLTNVRVWLHHSPRVENLKKGAEPVNNAAIIDMIQTNIFEDIGCGPLCQVNPLTNRGKRFQLIKILCLTVIPILGVWGFTMYSLSDSVKSKTDIETAKRSMTIVVMLGRLIHRLQRERDMSVLYLSDLGPGTKTFLLAEYIATDDALQKLSVWPGELKKSPREEFRSKANLMTYISQHRNSLNPATVDLYVEINFYSSITREFLEWLVENIKGSGFGSTWKTLVAYQKITRCKENIGVERAYGAMFYAYGGFPSWGDFEFYNEKIHDFKYNYKTAVFYSAIVVPLHTEEVKEIKSSGLNITAIINTYRGEIQYHDPIKNYTSNEKAKWFFDNMTEYLDSLLGIQEEVAHRISEEVDEVLASVLFKVVVYAVLVVVVIGMCPIIMFSSEALASDIQRYTQTLVAKTTELNIEKHKANTLLFQMVPKSIAKKLKAQCTYTESDFFKICTIMFTDLFGFTQTTRDWSPRQLVSFLNNLQDMFEERIQTYDAYKVETINDCYMVASGVPNRNGENHVTEIGTLALDLLHLMNHMTFAAPHTRGLNIRIGIHTGSCLAGIVGTVMLKYCLFGETVFIASRMKSTGLPNKIHISDKVVAHLKKCGKFKMKLRGAVDIKGRGKVSTYWLLDKNEFDSANNDPAERCGSLDDDLKKEIHKFGRDMDIRRASFQSNASDMSGVDNKDLAMSFLKMPVNEWKEEEIFDKC